MTCPTCGTRLRVDRQSGEEYCPLHRNALARNLLLFEDDRPAPGPEQQTLDFEDGYDWHERLCGLLRSS